MANPNPSKPFIKGVSYYKPQSYKIAGLPVEENEDALTIGGITFTFLEAVELRNKITVWANTKRTRDKNRENVK